MQKSKMAVWGGLTNSCEKKRSKKQRRPEINKVGKEIEERQTETLHREEDRMEQREI